MKRVVFVGTGLLALLLTACCNVPSVCDPIVDTDFREEMRTLVEEIAIYARETSPDADASFLLVPQNGQELMTTDGNEDGPAATDYLDVVDGTGREDLLYGYNDDNVATPASETAYLQAFLDIAETNGVEVFVTDYAWDSAKVDDSYASNAASGYVAFAADSRDLETIPGYPTSPYGAHAGAVTTLSDVANFLYIINPSEYADGDALVAAIDAENFDLFIIDLFDDAGAALTPAHIAALQTKPGGASRLVLAYLSIGEAEDYRYYWDSTWEADPPSWIERENPDWPGNYKVRYWEEEWKAILFGDSAAYLDRILAAGFDGVYLDIIDGFEYFEANY